MAKENKKEMPLATKIMIALALGIVTGIATYSLPSGTLKDTILINGVFEIVGQIFLRAIMMIVVPLVFISLVNGAASMGDISKLGRVGGKTILFYMSTTALAIIISLAIGFIVQPGQGLDMGSIEAIETTAAEAVPLSQTLIEIIPKNPIMALAEGNMLQIIAFAILTGVGLSIMGDKAAAVSQLFEQMNDLIMLLVSIVMKLAPIGVFGLIAKTFAEMGISVFIPLAKYILAVYLGLFIHLIVVYSSIFKVFTGLSIKTFYKKFYPAMAVAFSTASSGATLPVSLDLAENQLGASLETASFTLPLGSTINMDGTAIMQGIATFFVAGVYGIPVTLNMMITVVVTATLASIGTAGVPGAGAIMLSMVLQSVGLPLEGIALIMGVDRIVDMGRTAVNITGDAICTMIIAQQEDNLDEDVFNS